MLIALIPAAFLPNKSTGGNEPSGTARLGAMMGEWKTTGTMFKTKFSHAGNTSSVMRCTWSADHVFVISDQVIKTEQGEKNQLSVFGYDTHSKEYYSYTFFAAGGAPFVSHPEIRGNVWIYNGEFKNGEITVRTRTTDTFISPSLMIFETQFCEDGVNWVTMMKGKDVRVK